MSRPLALMMGLLCVLGLAPNAGAANGAALAAPPATFIGIRPDAAAGTILLDPASLPGPFLLVATLERAIGSNDLGLDRAQNGDALLVEFRRAGKRLMLVQLNTRFRSGSPDAAEAQAATDAFAEAVLWSGEIKEEKGRARVDIAPLVASDLLGVADRLRQAEQGRYTLAAERSAALAERSAVFPDNAEFAAILTFTGEGEGEFLKQAAADPRTVSVGQRVAFVRLPGPGFVPRAYHPGSGAWSTGYLDFAQPVDRSLEVRWQPRFRLEKTDPGAARSTVVKPIVFYLDRGTPEPIRSALLEGANWWSAAFDAAGYVDAFRAELAPEGMSMSDVRYNTITWTHRATRGWSFGGDLVDPRNGEIIKGYVNLGSQRVRQDLLIAEGLLAPYAPGTDPTLAREAMDMALARLRQLAAHEVGHALGFAHNFAASRARDGSVLDYPHPVVGLDPDGAPRLRAPYRVGLGEWDHFIVAHAYRDFAPGAESTGLAALRADIAARGYRYVSDPDARAVEDASASGLLWDLPDDPIAGLDTLLGVRSAALARFAAGAVPPGRQLGEAERRLVPIYLLHRYQAEAVIRLLGGSDYRYGLSGDTEAGVQAVDGALQTRALESSRALLGVDVLMLPESVLAMLTPPSNDYQRGPEHFATRMAPLFDPLEAAASATALVATLALAPERLDRLAWQHARDPAVPSLQAVFDAFVAAPWQERRAQGPAQLVQRARDLVLVDAALLLLDGGKLSPAVDAEWRSLLAALARSLDSGRDAARGETAQRIRRYLADPASIKLRALPEVPPGAPI